MLKSDTPYLFSHQADAAVMAWAALSQGKPFLLGDQPGVGKTRTMLATSILYRQTQSQSKKKALIIVNNDAQVNVFRCDMSSYKNFLTDQDDMAIDIKKISEVQKMKDFSNYDLVMVDEVHSMIDGKSIKGEKDGKLNDLLSAIEDKNVLLASATAAKSLEELTSIRPILEHSRSKSKRKRQKKSNTDAMIKSSLFVEQLQESGQMISRMLSDSKKLGDDIKQGKTDVCHIQNISEYTSLTKELHTIYNDIINKIAALRTICAQTQGKSYYDQDNASLLAYIQRAREDIIKYQLISDAVQRRQEDPGYHTMICVREYGCQKNRITGILDGFRKHLSEGDEQSIVVQELTDHIAAFEQKC
ncbi:MAG: DEAD/DEAH box helicase family protein, partial [Bacteroidota bacterium]|nr:DEAD/DEAH box helicase family protein [Bacteroidota bacterium]